MLDLDHLNSLQPPAAPLNRRALVKASLTIGFCAAVTPVWAQVITTSTDGLVAGEVKIPAGGVDLPAYRAMPAQGGPFPTVLVIHEVFGVHEYIKDVCRRLAHEGYLAIAPELYARQGDLSKMTDVNKIITDVILQAPDDRKMSDLDSALTWAAAHYGDTSHTAVMGFCRGGRDTWLYAEYNPYLKAAAAFYGPVTGETSAIQPVTPLQGARALKCPLLGLYGALDDGIKIEDVERAAALAKTAGQTVRVEILANARHGFHADYRPSYNKAAAEQAWAHALAWFRAHGVG